MLFNDLISKMIPLFPEKFIWLFAKNYIAGSSLGDAVSVALELNKEGTSVTLDLLGESNDDPDKSAMYKKHYLEILDSLIQNNINGNCSLKPTMFGLKQDYQGCYNNIRDIISYAKEHNRYVRIDMEDSDCVDDELKLIRKLKHEFPETTGPVFQAYLKRTESDLHDILDLKHNKGLSVRLCKGIYNEPADIAYKDFDAINERYLTHLEYLLLNGVHTCIATHDETLIRKSMEFIERFSVDSDLFEFQMLYGVTPHLKKKIKSRGYSMRVYVPFGKEWMLYSVRRLKENPKMISYIMESVFSLRHNV